MIRPAEQLVHTGPVAVIDGRVCDLLDKRVDLNRLRDEVRLLDTQFYNTVLAMLMAAQAYQSSAAAGTKPVPQAVPVRQWNPDNTISTKATAALIGVSDSAIRKAIRQNRLRATKQGSGYRITRDDLAAYAARRKDR